MAEPTRQSLDGRIAIVTGATTGIGKEIARGLAARGARVIIGARTLARGDAARQELVESTGNPRIEVMRVDVASVASVRAFVATWFDVVTAIAELARICGELTGTPPLDPSSMPTLQPLAVG